MGELGIKEIVNSQKYDFLRTIPYLGKNILFLTLGGSYAYGTNNENSDIDIRGVALNRVEDILGYSPNVLEQYRNDELDTTVYLFNKFINLLISNNPNVIEMLGCREEDYFYLTNVGKEIIDNRHMFLSQRAINSFAGYAGQQLSRLENALARDRLPQAEKEEHIMRSLNNAINSFNDRYASYSSNSLKLYIDDSKREGFDKEIFANLHFDGMPARELNGILNELTNVIRTYDKLSHRNRKKDENHLDKHAMHLIRLYLMAFDILENEEIVTYREKDLPLLLSIRRGDYRLPNGTYRHEFFEMIDDFEKRLKYDAKNTNLPKEPNFKEINDFVQEVNKKTVMGTLNVKII